MKNGQNRLSKLKHDLHQRKENGASRVKWKLNDEQREYVERLGYEIRPYLYEIKTKKFQVLTKETSPLIRDIHWACKKGRKKLFYKLKKQEIKTLDAYDVQYKVYKYEVILK